MTLVYRQNYLDAAVPDAASFTPSCAVTIIVPVRDSGNGEGQARLNLVLASLGQQDYPQRLLKVIVVDDGSPTPIELSKQPWVPKNTRLLRLVDDGAAWGKSRALNVAIKQARTPLIMTLDADMLLAPDHVRQLARHAETIPNAVVLGYKRIVTEWNKDPATVADLIARGAWESTAEGPGQRHDWFEDTVDATGLLAQAGPDVFKAFVGASVLTTKRLLDRAGGYDPDMRLAEDTEMGYRLAQAGAVFIPQRDARAWHLGETAMAAGRDGILDHNWALLATRVPLLDYLRRGRNTVRNRVATVHVNVHVTPATARAARELVAHLVGGRLGVDATVSLVGAWPGAGRYRAQDDADGAMRALRNLFDGEPAVSVTDTATPNPFPAPYLIDATGDLPLSGVRALLDRLRNENLGVVAAAGDSIVPGTIAAWRTAALSRIEYLDGNIPTDAVDRVNRVGDAWGAWWVDAETLGVRSDASHVSPVFDASAVASNSVVRHAKTAWRSWVQAGCTPDSAKTISVGLARGASRKGRRLLKRKLNAAASRL